MNYISMKKITVVQANEGGSSMRHLSLNWSSGALRLGWAGGREQSAPQVLVVPRCQAVIQVEALPGV